MQTSKWGNSFWESLHTITFNYPEVINNENYEKKNIYYNYFKSLQDILPCKYCRDSYKIFFKYIELNSFLDDRMGVVYWLYMLHNLVNIKLNKEIYPFYKVVKYYESFRAGNEKIDQKKFIEETLQKYENIIINMIIKLYNSKESPIPRENWKLF